MAAFRLPDDNDEREYAWDSYATWAAFEMVRRSGLHNMYTEFSEALVDAASVLVTLYERSSEANALITTTRDTREVRRVFLRYTTRNDVEFERAQDFADVLPQGREFLRGMEAMREAGVPIDDDQRRLFEQWREWNVEPRIGVVLTARRFLAAEAHSIFRSGIVRAPIEVSTITNEYTMAGYGVQLFAAGIISRRSPFEASTDSSVTPSDTSSDDTSSDEDARRRVKRLRDRAGLRWTPK